MFHWIHHLFNPHCEKCHDEINECKSCEILQRQLDQRTRENERLMELLLTKPESPIEQPLSTAEPIRTSNFRAWSARRAELEAADRQRAKLMRESATGNEKVEDLEKELLDAPAGT